jgi:MEDS: MEthanogen/methylotroph, DcmR Sensory domain
MTETVPLGLLGLHVPCGTHICSFYRGAQGRDEIVLPAELNEVIPNHAQVILCLYDLERFGADVLMDTLRTHPRVVVDGMVHENPYYIEPGKFLHSQG